MTSRRIRYIVTFNNNDPRACYNSGIGDALARKCAMYTARTYGGRCHAEYADGTFEEISTFGSPVIGQDLRRAA